MPELGPSRRKPGPRARTHLRRAPAELDTWDSPQKTQSQSPHPHQGCFTLRKPSSLQQGAGTRDAPAWHVSPGLPKQRQKHNKQQQRAADSRQTFPSYFLPGSVCAFSPSPTRKLLLPSEGNNKMILRRTKPAPSQREPRCKTPAPPGEEPGEAPSPRSCSPPSRAGSSCAKQSGPCQAESHLRGGCRIFGGCPELRGSHGVLLGCPNLEPAAGFLGTQGSAPFWVGRGACEHPRGWS